MKKIFYIFLLLCINLTIKAATITVTSGADAGAGTLRAAIASAVAGDDIVFSGVTTVTLTSGQLVINKNLTINGGTSVTITRSGATEFRIFIISGAATTVVFNKLTITNGKQASQAGGVENNGTLTLNDCIIANNQAGQGGGLQNNGTMTMNRCFVHNNTMTAGGGGCGLIIYSTKSTTLNNCVFTNNQLGWAIDIQSTGTLNITNCTIAKNTGGINVGKSSAVVTLKNTIVAENTTGSNANILNKVSASSAYNLIGTEGGNGGLTNDTNNNKVGLSPLFANSSDPDGADNIFGTVDDGLRLTACNYATNAGNNADAPAGTDILGNPRIFATTVDMGAYEFQANSVLVPTITLGTIPTILAGVTTFTIPYTATTGSPTTYSISGTGITSATDVALPSSPITVNLSPAASANLSLSLTVKNAGGCTFSVTVPVTVSQSATWTGAISTDWHNAGNWSPNGIPTASNSLTIPNLSNKPVILSGATATCSSIGIGTSASLTINSGGTLTVLPKLANSTCIYINSKGTFTNNGTLVCTATGNIDGIALPDSTTFNNNGTATFSVGATDILLGGPDTRLNNSATGIINILAGIGIRTLAGAGKTGTVIINQGTINYSGGNVAIILKPNYTFNNSGTIQITKGGGILNEAGILNNLACGKIFISNTVNGLNNAVAGSVVNNAGLIVTHNFNNTNGIFSNIGVLKYDSLIGKITSNQNSSLIVNNTEPIFAYGGTYDGTINGIFTDSLTTVSAGKFEDPNTFTPLATLPKGTQKLYVKVTPAGGACAYTVPFTYKNWLGTPTKEIAINTAELHQNRPNPFSQETLISFNLLENDKAELSVFDINGKQIFTSYKTFKIGYNEVILDKSVFQSTGIYVYRLTSGNFSTVKRLLFVAE